MFCSSDSYLPENILLDFLIRTHIKIASDGKKQVDFYLFSYPSLTTHHRAVDKGLFFGQVLSYSTSTFK